MEFLSWAELSHAPHETATPSRRLAAGLAWPEKKNSKSVSTVGVDVCLNVGTQPLTASGRNTTFNHPGRASSGQGTMHVALHMEGKVSVENLNNMEPSLGVGTVQGSPRSIFGIFNRETDHPMSVCHPHTLQSRGLSLAGWEKKAPQVSSDEIEPRQMQYPRLGSRYHPLRFPSRPRLHSAAIQLSQARSVIGGMELTSYTSDDSYDAHPFTPMRSPNLTFHARHLIRSQLYLLPSLAPSPAACVLPVPAYRRTDSRIRSPERARQHGEQQFTRWHHPSSSFAMTCIHIGTFCVLLQRGRPG